MRVVTRTDDKSCAKGCSDALSARRLSFLVTAETLQTSGQVDHRVVDRPILCVRRASCHCSTFAERENEVRLVDLDALCLRFYGWMNPGLRGRILALPQIFQQVIVDQLGERTGVPSYCGIDDRLLRKQPSRDGLTRGLANLAQEHRLRVLPSRWGGVFPLRLHSLNFFSRIGTERLPTFLNLSTRDVSQDLSGVPLLTGPAIHYKSHHDISDIHEGPLRPER